MVADTCRKNPGTWVLASKRVNGATTTHIKNARIQAFQPAGSFDAMLRKGVGIFGWVFVRYIPEGERKQ